MRGQVVLLVLCCVYAYAKNDKVARNEERHGLEIRNGFPSSKAFQKQKDALLMTSAFGAGSLPKDSALVAIPHAVTTFVTPVGQKQLSLRQFLSQYRNTPDIYLDQVIIDTFKALLPLPKILYCPFFTSSLLSSRIIWRYAEERVKVDFAGANRNALHCVADGTGNLRISVNNQKEETITVKPGDCLYLPPQQHATWDLQGRVIMILITWSGNHPSSEKCIKGDEEEKVIANCNFKEDPSPDIFSLISLNTLTTFFEDYHLTQNCTQETFNRRFKKKHLQKLVEWNDETQAVADELFMQMDINEDGLLSLEDVENLTPQEIRHLAGILSDRVSDMTDIAGDQEQEKPKNRGPVGVAEGLKADYEKELQAILEDGFNEILQESNLPGRVSFDKDGKPQVERISDKEPEKPKRSPPPSKEEL